MEYTLNALNAATTRAGLAGVASQPILVTGMPRSGTTWLARLLAAAPGSALAGREPMNPRGKQYALGGTLPGWTRLDEPSPRQRRALQLAYRGLNPWVYSRYGRRQWAAPLPWTRIIVKDPFAMLSLPAVSRTTGARIVFVYRHPGAVLASYRRMGWDPDLLELAPLVDSHRVRAADDGLDVADLPLPGEVGAPEAMGRFWGALHAMALRDAQQTPGLVVVSHAELAGGGAAAARRLYGALGLPWSRQAEAGLAQEATTSDARTGGLHDFDRDPAQVANAWRAKLAPGELEAVEAVTVGMRDHLEEIRLPLRSVPGGQDRS